MQHRSGSYSIILVILAAYILSSMILGNIHDHPFDITDNPNCPAYLYSLSSASDIPAGTENPQTLPLISNRLVLDDQEKPAVSICNHPLISRAPPVI